MTTTLAAARSREYGQRLVGPGKYPSPCSRTRRRVAALCNSTVAPSANGCCGPSTNRCQLQHSSCSSHERGNVGTCFCWATFHPIITNPACRAWPPGITVPLPLVIRYSSLLSTPATRSPAHRTMVFLIAFVEQARHLHQVGSLGADNKPYVSAQFLGVQYRSGTADEPRNPGTTLRQGGYCSVG